MGSRAELVAALRDALPTTIRVLDAPKVPDKPGAGITALIVVERASVDPGPSLGTYSEEHHLHVLSPSTDPNRIDDGLDDALDDLLEALLPLPWIAFRRAVRSTFADTFHSYDVTTTVTTSSTTDTPATPKE